MRLVHCPEKLVTGQVTGVQFYPQTKDSKKDYIYVVNVVCLPEGHYELQLFKVWFKCKFPDHIISQAPMQASSLEMRLVRASQDLLKIAETRLRATVRDMQLLFMVDAHNALRLVGTQQTLLRDIAECASRSRLNNFRLPTPFSLAQSRSRSTQLIESRTESRPSETPPHPYTNLIRPKFKAKIRQPAMKPSPLSSHLLVMPKRRSSKTVTEAPKRGTSNELMMVDQEAQATHGELQDSLEGPPTHSRSSLSRLRGSPSRNTSAFFHRPSHSSLGYCVQSVNSTVILPEPESVSKFGAVRLGSLSNSRKSQPGQGALRLIRRY